MPLHNYSDAELVARAVHNARASTPGPVERWVAVRDTFAIGSRYAKDLCRDHLLDPHETNPFHTVQYMDPDEAAILAMTDEECSRGPLMC